MTDDERNQPPLAERTGLITYIWSTMCSTIAPQDTPHSHTLRTTLIVALLAVNLISEFISGRQFSALLYAIIDLAFLFVFVKIILIAFRFTERVPQTFNALLAAHTGFTIILLPIHYLSIEYGLIDGQAATSDDALMRTLLGFIMLGMFIWMLRATGYIYSQALEIRLVFAIGIAFLYMLSNFLIVANVVVHLTR